MKYPKKEIDWVLNDFENVPASRMVQFNYTISKCGVENGTVLSVSFCNEHGFQLEFFFICSRLEIPQVLLY